MFKNALLILAAILIIALSITTYLFATPHMWKSLSDVKVSRDGEIASETSIYRSSQGDILIALKSGNHPYIFYPSHRRIGIPNANAFIYIPGYAFSKEVRPPVVLSDNRSKVETDMNIVYLQNGFEFTSFDGDRIRVEFNR